MHSISTLSKLPFTKGFISHYSPFTGPCRNECDVILPFSLFLVSGTPSFVLQDNVCIFLRAKTTDFKTHLSQTFR